MNLIFSSFQTIFAFVIILSILVFVHEFGHYLGCVICKVKVDSFSIGMGKELVGWTDKKGVRWKLSMLPFGGYLKMYGDEDVASGKADKSVLDKMTEEDKKVSFYFQNPYKKFLIVFFGPLFNLVFSVLLITTIIKVNGVNEVKPIVNLVVENSPAYNAGLQNNDIILSINNKKIKDFNQISSLVVLNHLKPLNVKLLRNGEEIETTIIPEIKEAQDMFGNKVNSPSIGIGSFPYDYQKVSLFTAFIKANKNVVKMCKDTLIVLGQMITGNRGVDNIGGPLKIAKYSSQSFDAGFMMVIYFMALISANLGLMNLLPIPVLDGGHLIFFLIEMITKKEIPEKIQDKLLKGGFAFLIALMVFATFNDILGFFK